MYFVRTTPYHSSNPAEALKTGTFSKCATFLFTVVKQVNADQTKHKRVTFPRILPPATWLDFGYNREAEADEGLFHMSPALSSCPVLNLRNGEVNLHNQRQRFLSILQHF